MDCNESVIIVFDSDDIEGFRQAYIKEYGKCDASCHHLINDMHSGICACKNPSEKMSEWEGWGTWNTEERVDEILYDYLTSLLKEHYFFGIVRCDVRECFRELCGRLRIDIGKFQKGFDGLVEDLGDVVAENGGDEFLFPKEYRDKVKGFASKLEDGIGWKYAVGAMYLKQDNGGYALAGATKDALEKLSRKENDGFAVIFPCVPVEFD